MLYWIGIILLLLLFIWYRWSMSGYWKLKFKGINCLKPIPFVGGHNMDMITRKRPIYDSFVETYNRLKEFDVGAYFFFGSPIIVVNDLDLIKEVAVKHFDHFMDRLVIPEMQQVIKEQDKMLVSLTGERWKVMRAALSPSFTSGKLKGLVATLDSLGPDFTKYLNKLVKEGKEFDMRAAFGRHTMGMIAQAVFGIDAKAYEDIESDFVANANRLNKFSGIRALIVFLLYTFVPKFAKALRLRFNSNEPVNFLKNAASQVMNHRVQNNQRANDMLQVLMDYRDKVSELDSEPTENDNFENDAKLDMKIDAKSLMSDDAITQSAVLFLLAGFDTTSTTLSLVTYHLACNQDIQQKARQIVDDVVSDMGEKENLNYNDLSKMDYLEQIIHESLRISTIAVAIERVCTKDFTLSNGVKIDKGQRVQFLGAGIQSDEQYWPKPDVFDPDRFSKENKKNINPYAYLPFGAGPRNCIGMRFALMEAKIALFHLLKDFELHPSAKTPIPIEYDKGYFQTYVKGGNILKLIPRN